MLDQRRPRVFRLLETELAALPVVDPHDGDERASEADLEPPFSHEACRDGVDVTDGFACHISQGWHPRPHKPLQGTSWNATASVTQWPGACDHSKPNRRRCRRLTPVSGVNAGRRVPRMSPLAISFSVTASMSRRSSRPTLSMDGPPHYISHPAKDTCCTHEEQRAGDAASAGCRFKAAAVVVLHSFQHELDLVVQGPFTDTDGLRKHVHADRTVPPRFGLWPMAGEPAQWSAS